MIYGCKFRLYPTKEQATQMRQMGGCCRYTYNSFVAYCNELLKKGQRIPKLNDLKNIILKDLKERFPWLKDCNAQSLQYVVDRIFEAFMDFLTKKKGHPDFKKKGWGDDTFHIPQHFKVDYRKSVVWIPKIGWVKCVIHRRVVGQIRNATVCITPAGEYYVSINANDGKDYIPPEVNEESKVLGIDLGLTSWAICSDGTVFENPKVAKKYQKKLSREQKSLARKVKGSNNYKKQKKVVAEVHKKIRNCRKDGQNKMTNQICKSQADIVAMENLNNSGMLRNHKLAYHIADAAWYEIRRQIEYKCKREGKMLILVDRFYPSSQTCSTCGYVNKEVKDLRVREWTCPVCGSHHDRDFNASVNIAKNGKEKALLAGRKDVKPVEIAPVDERAKAPKKHAVNLKEAGEVLVHDARSPKPQEAACCG